MLSFMQNDLVLALCWTLIHSIWQGLLLSIATGGVMIITRKSNAKKRYRLLAVLFGMFMVTVVITFIREMSVSSATANRATLSAITQKANVTIDAVQANDFSADKTLPEKFKDYFNTHASLIVMIWLVIFMARLIRLTANLAYVQRLKYYKTCNPSAEWLNKIGELMDKLGIHKKIQLLESGVIKVPVVIGMLKPVILVPIGLLNQLPADEIEAILLHELAHIQRRDYFVNLMQSFAETLFFFNPAVMWLSSVIREERENCCDDIAISVTNSKTQFINALIAFQEYNFSSSGVAVGFPGKKNQLLNRVKRIVHNRNKTLNATEKSLITLGMGVLILFSFASAKKIAPPVSKKTEAKQMIVRNEKAVQSAANESSFALVPEQHRSFSGENIAGAASSYSLSPANHTDTLPEKLSFKTDTLKDRYTNLSTSLSENDDTRKLSISAKRKDGFMIAFIKINDQLTELTVNNEKIEEKEYPKYYDDIYEVESISRYRRNRSIGERALADDRRREMFDSKKRNMEEKRMELQQQRLELQQKQRMDMNAKHLYLDNNMRRDTLENKRIGLKMKREEMNQQRVKFMSVEKQDSIAYAHRFEYKKMDSLDHIKREVYQKKMLDGVEFRKMPGLGKMKDTLDHIKQELYQKKMLNGVEFRKMQGLGKMKDTLGKLNGQDEDLASLDKQEWLRKRRREDAIKGHNTAEIMKSIIADLEKEGVKIDLQKSWFALDKDQFIVDGKKMTAELHERFRNKYVQSNINGWGFYYGPIQVHGTGIFMDYKDISR